jgi:hypothetical protein
MDICGAISKYGIENFTLYILDIIEISNLDDKLKLFEDLMNKEDY